MSTRTAQLLEGAKALSPDELREFADELSRLSESGGKPAKAGVPKKLWDHEEHMRWLKQTWGDRIFTAEEVQEMKDAEDGLIA